MSMVDRRAIVYFDVDTLELIVHQPMPDQIARFVILKKLRAVTSKKTCAETSPASATGLSVCVNSPPPNVLTFTRNPLAKGFYQS